ncbi:MAG: undecaprenyl-diphosphate phosphatase [Deltaproteobacteria bacterium]|nr:undecaprenyl-diphosphate phosphatase [Deltaproteobacteria bacterium]
MSIADAVLLGVVQGLTEFLPVSSSGHLVLFEHVVQSFDADGALLFNVTLHLGTLFSVLVYYRRDLAGMVGRLFSPSGVPVSGSAPPISPDWRFLGLIVLAMLVTALFGFPLRDWAEALFGESRGGEQLMSDSQRLRFVGIALIVTGVLLALSERLQSGKAGRENLGWRDALLIGAAQGLAVIPGISRSGATISAALFRGVDAVQAVRFSFLLSVPAIVAAEFYALYAKGGETAAPLAAGDLAAYGLGALTAFAVGLLAIKVIVGTARRGRLTYFAIYCWAVGGMVAVLA